MRIVFTIVLLLSTTASAEVKYELPLDRWCRVGQFLPVRVTAFSPGDVLKLPGCVDMHVSAAGIVPVFVLEQTWQLRAIGERQRLVVTTIDDDAKTTGDPNVLSMRVNVQDLSSLLAWEAADEIVLGEADLGLLGHDFVRRALAMGIVVRVRSENKPAGFSWKKSGNAWVMEGPFPGFNSRINSDAYLPAVGWRPGRDAGMRQRVVLFAAVFCVVVLAASLLKVRWAVGVIVGISVAATAALLLVERQLSDVVIARGSIIITSPDLSQHDRWTYYSALDREEVRIDLDRQAPVFDSVNHARRMNLSIHQDARGQCLLHATLGKGVTLATQSSIIAPWSPEDSDFAGGLTSPLVSLARAYLEPGASIKGELKVGFDWPSVVIAKR